MQRLRSLACRTHAEALAGSHKALGDAGIFCWHVFGISGLVPLETLAMPFPPLTPPALHAALAAGLAALLLAGCATPGGHGGGVDASRAATPEVLTVQDVQGAATLQQGSTVTALRAGMTIGEGLPVQVKAGSVLRLNLGKLALLELGPQSRLIVHKLPRAGDVTQRATWLRLERGYLRVVAAASVDGRRWPMELSFARWLAKFGGGEFFFDSAIKNASACAAQGTMQLSGVPDSTPAKMTEPCVKLRAQNAPTLLTLAADDWDVLRRQRTLAASLRKAEVREASEAARALAALEKELAAEARAKQAARRAAARQEAARQRIATLPPAPARTALQPQPATPPPAIGPPPVAAARSTGPINPVPSPAAPPAPALAEPAAVPPALALAPQLESPPLYTEPDKLGASRLDDSAAAAPAVESATTERAALSAGTALSTPGEPLQLPPDADPLLASSTAATDSGPAVGDSGKTELALLSPAVPSPATESEEIAPAGRWIVNVESHATMRAAEEQANALAANGFPAKVRIETFRDTTSYRVVIEKDYSEAAAMAVVEDLDTRMGMESAWILRQQ